MRMLSVSLLLCAVTALTAAAPAGDSVVVNMWARCPTGWDGFSGNCYKYEKEKMDWADAERVCLALGANLASIHSAGENKFIHELILSNAGKPKESWVGGCDAAKNGVWLWSDGSPVTYTAWGKGQPDNAGDKEHCMHVNWGQKDVWNDATCKTVFPSVCKKPADALTTIT